MRSVAAMNFQRSSSSRQLVGWRSAESCPAQRAVLRALGQHLVEDGLVGEAEDVVEVALRVLGIAARVGTAEDRDGAARRGTGR